MARFKNNPTWFNNYSKKDFEALTYNIKPGEDAFQTLQRLIDDDYTNMIKYFYIFKPDSTGKYYWYVFDGETYCLLSKALKKRKEYHTELTRSRKEKE